MTTHKTFRWLPPALRPPVAIEPRVERIFLLVGAAAFFAGYDMNIFSWRRRRSRRHSTFPKTPSH